MDDHELAETGDRPNLAVRMLDALKKDGMLAAAFRQGADEIGVALKAFPESIHAEEPGTLLNPTQGEIAAAREMDRLPTPSEIAKNRTPYTPEHGQDHGQDMER